MKPRLRILLLLFVWPVGVPYLLYARGRAKAAWTVALAFGVATIVALAAVPWRDDPGTAVPGTRTQDPGSAVPATRKSEAGPHAYRILSDERIGKTKRTVAVRLADKVTADLLQRIAYEIRDSAPTQYERTFILYYLPDTSTDRPAWASTHFKPELEVAIRGTTLEQDQQVTTPLR